VTHQVAAIGVEEVHPQPACLNFDGPHEFDINFDGQHCFSEVIMED